MSTNTPEALRLADELCNLSYQEEAYCLDVFENAARELRRLHAENERLRQLIAYQGMDDTADLPPIIKHQAS